MSDNFWRARVREGAVLDPVDRISEVLFGLIMVLSFTGAISVATDGRNEIRELLWSALGCNVAWWFVDAIMYLMNVAVDRGHSIAVLQKISQTSNTESIRDILRGEIRPAVGAIVTNEELDRMGERLKKLPEPSKRYLLTLADFRAGIEIFFLVFLCTLPVALPFAFFNEIGLALQVSNGVALLMLFIGGYLLARYAGFRRYLTAFIYVIIGVALVSLTMALGG